MALVWQLVVKLRCAVNGNVVLFVPVIVSVVPVVIFATLVCWPLSSALMLWSSCTACFSTNAILFRRVHEPLEVTMVNW